jgi:hypothetical protein
MKETVCSPYRSQYEMSSVNVPHAKCPVYETSYACLRKGISNWPKVRAIVIPFNIYPQFLNESATSVFFLKK